MQGQKTISLSYNMHLVFTLFAQRLPNDSAFVSAVLLCVQRYRGNSYFYCSKAVPSGKELHFSFRPSRKDQQVGGHYANVSC